MNSKLRPDWSWFVATVWAVMVAHTVVFCFSHVRNLPVHEEWEFVPAILGQTSDLEFIFAKHNEHRYPVGRAIYLGLLRITGVWFPANSVLSGILLASSALVLVRVVNRVRGEFHPLDAWLPVLLLGAAHYENLVMGYQIVFTLTILLVVLLIGVVARSRDWEPTTVGFVAGLLLLGIMTGGGVGLLFVPTVGPWVGCQLWRAFHAGESRLRLIVASLPLLLVSGFAAWAIPDVVRGPGVAERNDVTATLLHTAEFFAEGLGTISLFIWPYSAIVVALLEAVTVVGLVLVAWRNPGDRPTALGWLAVMGGVSLIALAVGHSRPSAFASRYAGLSCLNLVIGLLTAARYGPKLPRWSVIPFAVITIVTAVALCWGNLWYARIHCGLLERRYQVMNQDIAAGVPLDFIADRNVLYPEPYYREHFKLLHDSGFKPLQSIVYMPLMTSETIPLTPGSRIPAWQPDYQSSPPRLMLPIQSDRIIAAIRLRFHCPDTRYWQQFNLRWVSATTGEVRTSSVYPWLAPGESTTSFWINDRVREVWIEPGSATPGLAVIAIEVCSPAAE